MANQIVTVAVTQTVGATPSILQQSGAFISQGATTLPQNSLQLLTTSADLAPILTGAVVLSSLTWAAGVVTATTAVAHNFTVSDVLQLTVAGASPIGYNGVVQANIINTTQFTYVLATNPGVNVTPGVVTIEDVQELVAMNNTFWTQGSNLSVYVLELGQGSPAQGMATLQAWIALNPLVLYSYLVPRNWADEPTYPAFLNLYSGTTAQTYFFTTVSLGNYTNFSPGLQKCVYAEIEAPAVATAAAAGTATEFSLAASFYVTLNYAPSPANLVPPLAFAYIFGVTPYPTAGNSALFAALRTANINWVGTGAEGGISNTMVLWGHTMDSNPFNYWYSVDNVIINVNLQVSNEVINGSNNRQNPLYYNQAGIDRLQARAQQVMNAEISFGLALAPVTVNAVSFVAYLTTNPGDYKIGRYDGLSVTYTPARGFESITFNVDVSTIPIGPN